jgi:hypothetical protein
MPKGMEFLINELATVLLEIPAFRQSGPGVVLSGLFFGSFFVTGQRKNTGLGALAPTNKKLRFVPELALIVRYILGELSQDILQILCQIHSFNGSIP